jgi:hypothetical protein
MSTRVCFRGYEDLVYVPDRETLTRLAVEVGVYLRSSDQEWKERTRLSAPGPVWVVESDTCATGRLEAPDNVGYDEDCCEFVYRQPRDERELKDVLRAAAADPFDAYRFDGLARWTYDDALDWYDSRHTLLEVLERPNPGDAELPAGILLSSDDEVAAGMRAASAHYRSAEFHTAMAEVLDYLR